jgi:2-dehydropantoate 2-reductase
LPKYAPRPDSGAKIQSRRRGTSHSHFAILEGLDVAEPGILVEGIGGLGGVIAARLIQAGYHPVLVTRNPAIASAINEHGLRVTTPEGSATIPASAYASLADLPRGSQFGAAYLLMKANNVLEAAWETLPFLASDGYVVTFQNGIVEDAVAERIGGERVIGALIGWGGTMHAPGVYEKTSGGSTHIGELDGGLSERVRALGGILEAFAPVVVTQNIYGALWSKLAINCVITTLGALTGDTLGVMLQDKRIRRIFLQTYREVVDTAEALGIALERVAANPKLLYLPERAGPLAALAKDVLAQVVGRRYGRIKSSSLQSLQRGRKTEIDYLNGYVVEKARTVGVDVPVNVAIVRMIKEIENGARQIARDNVNDLMAVLT